MSQDDIPTGDDEYRSFPTQSYEQDEDDMGCTTDSDSELKPKTPEQEVPEEERWAAQENSSCQWNSEASDGEEDGLTATWYWGDKRLPVQPADESLPQAATQHLDKLFLEDNDVAPKPAERETAAEHRCAWRKMSEVAFRHFVRSVRECCMRMGGGLEEPKCILGICELAQQVVDHLLPSAGDAMDILSYVKVKCISSSGGQISDSSVVDGVVFSRDVAHRKMRSVIHNCHLALLRESVSYDHDHRLTRLEELKRQEAASMDLKVGKIADDLKPMPDLLLCQGGVSRIAQEKLRNRNISLVLGVPAHILDAVARCTGAKVLQSVDSIVRCAAEGKNSVVGQCQSFMVKRKEEVPGAVLKPLVFIEGGARPEQFSTVCLRGEDAQLLARAKRVLKWAIRLARHLQLESELLFEMWCEPWPRTQPAVAPLCDALLKEVEHLDLICYKVRNRNCTSTKPVMLRLPAYSLPKPLQQLPSAVPPSVWAGGSSGPLEGHVDSTLNEWLVRCFSQERGGIGAFPGDEGRLAPEASCALLETSGDSGCPLVMESARLGGSGEVGLCGLSHSRLVPEPGSTELCLQHGQSRVVVFMLDQESLNTKTIRARGMSSTLRRESFASRTRWSLLEHDEEEEGAQDDECKVSCAASAASSPANALEVEMWQWCRKWDRATPHSALSSSARWHSTTRFFELLLHKRRFESVRMVPPGSAEDGQEPHCHADCQHMHMLFFSSPQSSLTLGLYWEQVHLWRVLVPHLPYWSPETKLFTEQVPVDQDVKEVMDYLGQLRELENSIGGLTGCILLALSAADEQNLAEASGGRTEKSGMCLCERSSHGSASEHSEPLWLKEWVGGNRVVWHRALKHLTHLHAFLRKHLELAQDQLGGQSGTATNDPVLALYVQRDLLDSLREASSTNEAAIRSTQAALAAFRKTPQQPSDKVAVSSGWSYFAKETITRFWPYKAESSEVVATAVASEKPQHPVRTRSSSVSSRSDRRRRPLGGPVEQDRRRAHSTHPRHVEHGAAAAVGRPSGLWKRCSSDDGFASPRDRLDSLPDHVHCTLHMLGNMAEEGNKRLAAVERGAHGVCLPVQEDDVGSVITHALLSRQFQEQMSAQWAVLSGNRSMCCPLARPCNNEGSCCHASFPASLRKGCPPPVGSSVASLASMPESQPFQSALAELPWKRLPQQARESWEDQWEGQGVRSVLTALPQEPIHVEFEDKEAKYTVGVYHAAQYHILRHWLCGDDLNFARSLYRCKRIKPSGGKTGAAFFVSQHDGRFLVKAVNRAELKMLTTPSQAQAIFWYVDQVLFEKMPSVLAHVVGLFSVSVKPHKKSSGKLKHYIVQRNLRFSLQHQKRPHFVFDLKGVGNRKVQDEMPPGQADDSNNEGEAGAGEASAAQGGGKAVAGAKAVFWDRNLQEWTEGRPLSLVSADLKYLEAAIHNDTLFLKQQCLVDYSLLLAAAKPPQDRSGTPSPLSEPPTLALGIIDWLRPYTFDKRVETVVKTLAHGDRPTVIEPPKYAQRFLEAMGTFFVGEAPTSQPTS